MAHGIKMPALGLGMELGQSNACLVCMKPGSELQHHINEVWWHLLVTLVLRRVRQEDQKFKGTLIPKESLKPGYMRAYFKNKIKEKQEPLSVAVLVIGVKIREVVSLPRSHSQAADPVCLPPGAQLRWHCHLTSSTLLATLAPHSSWPLWVQTFLCPLLRQNSFQNLSNFAPGARLRRVPGGSVGSHWVRMTHFYCASFEPMPALDNLAGSCSCPGRWQWLPSVPPHSLRQKCRSSSSALSPLPTFSSGFCNLSLWGEETATIWAQGEQWVLRRKIRCQACPHTSLNCVGIPSGPHFVWLRVFQHASQALTSTLLSSLGLKEAESRLLGFEAEGEAKEAGGKMIHPGCLKAALILAIHQAFPSQCLISWF